MPQFLPTRIFLFLFSFFIPLFFSVQNVQASNHPYTTGSLSGPSILNIGQQGTFSVQVGDPDDDLAPGGKVQFYYTLTTDTSPGGNWQSMGIYNIQYPYGETASINWTPPVGFTPGTYYVTTNVTDKNLPADGCSGNYKCTVNGGTYNCGPTWTACRYTGGVNYDLMTVTVQNAPPPSPPSTINSLTVEPRHNIYDICQTSLPYPNSIEPQLLSYLNVTANITNNGGEGFNGYRIYVSWQNGDSAPPNTTLVSQDGQQWWRSNTVIPFFGSDNPGIYWLQGLPTGTGTRTVRIVLYNSSSGCEACGSYSAVKRDVANQRVDRNAPSYSATYSSPNWSDSPHLRTVTPPGSGNYTPTGTVGTQVTLEVNPINDTGGFGIDRVDLWVAYAAGDTELSTIRSGNPACAPSPPYDTYFGDLCKTTGPMNCANFSPGAGQAWYIGQANAGNSWRVTWNTNGFATGTRSIVANAFDCGSYPGCTRVGPNILTYTGNGVPANSAQVSYNLTLPISPWIKTTGGDVHTNGSISTPGGP